MLKFGTKTKWGRVTGIAWVGERYYFLTDQWGTVSFMPAVVVEA